MWRYVFKNFHYSFPQFPLIHFGNKKEFSWKIKMDSSCIYTPDKNNHTNKLVGVSFGNHMNNSIRFGWRPSNNKIELLYFIHENGKFYYNYMATIDTNKLYRIKILLSGNEVTFYVGNLKVGKYKYKISPFGRWGYFLNPYFGGKMKAPHFMKMFIK